MGLCSRIKYERTWKPGTVIIPKPKIKEWKNQIGKNIIIH